MEDEFSFENTYNKGQIIYFLRVIKNNGINEVVEAKIRTISKKSMVACVSKTKQVIYIGMDVKDMVFVDRKSASVASDNIKVRCFKHKIIEEED